MISLFYTSHVLMIGFNTFNGSNDIMIISTVEKNAKSIVHGVLFFQYAL